MKSSTGSNAVGVCVRIGVILFGGFGTVIALADGETARSRRFQGEELDHSQSASLDAAAIEGSWSGSVRFPDHNSPAVFTFAQEQDRWTASTALPNQSSRGLKTDIRVASPRITLRIHRGSSVALILEGRIRDGLFSGAAHRPSTEERLPFKFLRVVDVDTSTMEQYEGIYRFDSGERLRIECHRRQTDVVLTGNWAVSGRTRTLFPVSTTEFVTGPQADTPYPFQDHLTFAPDKSGATRLTWLGEDSATRTAIKLDVPVDRPSRAEQIKQLIATRDDMGAGWRYENLDMDVFLFPDRATVRLEGKATLKLHADSSIGPLLRVNEVMRFVEVRVPDDATANIGFQLGASVDVRFSHPKPRGTIVEIGFTCESVDSGYQFQVNPHIAYGSWAYSWYPHPMPHLESAQNPVAPPGEPCMKVLKRAPGIVRMHVPRGWRSLANGTLASSRETSDGLIEEWHSEQPVAWSFAAGPYKVTSHQLADREIQVFRLREPTDGNKRVAQVLADVLVALESRFGPYPYPKFALAEVPHDSSSWYASSEQGFILAQPAAFEEPSGGVPLFGHEISHAWWGNLVPADGRGRIVAGESIANYCSYLALEKVEGEAAAVEFIRFGKPAATLRGASDYFDIVTRGTDEKLSGITSAGSGDVLADSKAAWVYHMLRNRVGDEVFFDTMRSLIPKYSETWMSLDDVRSTFIEAAPEAELEQFFAQWLDRTGAPGLEMEWSAKGRDKCEVIIRQTQSGRPFRVDVDIAVVGATDTTWHVVKLTGRETRVVLESAGPPQEVRLDPKHRLLHWLPT